MNKLISSISILMILMLIFSCSQQEDFFAIKNNLMAIEDNNYDPDKDQDKEDFIVNNLLKNVCLKEELIKDKLVVEESLFEFVEKSTEVGIDVRGTLIANNVSGSIVELKGEILNVTNISGHQINLISSGDLSGEDIHGSKVNMVASTVVNLSSIHSSNICIQSSVVNTLSNASGSNIAIVGKSIEEKAVVEEIFDVRGHLVLENVIVKSMKQVSGHIYLLNSEIPDNLSGITVHIIE